MTGVDPRLLAAVREQLARRSVDDEHVGWKVGAGDRERIGDEPVAVGHLTSATVLEAGATYEDGCDGLRADVELAVEIGTRPTYAVALELVDLADDGDAQAVVAANVFHRAVAFGVFAPRCSWPPRARIVVNGEERCAASAPEDVLDRIGALTRVLTAAGEGIVPGDRIITGSIVQVPVTSGDAVLGEIDSLGAVRLEIA